MMACSKPEKEEIRCQIPSEKRQFTWRVDHWATVQKSKVMMDMTSVHFEMGTRIGLPVSIKVYLKEEEDKPKAEEKGTKDNEVAEKKKYVGLYFKVVLSPLDVSQVTMVVCVNIPNVFSSIRNQARNFTERSWGWSKFLAQDKDPSQLPLDANGSLPIELEVTLFNVKRAVSKILPPLQPPTPSPIPVVTAATLMAKWKEPFLQKLLRDKDDLRKTPANLPPALEMVVLVSKEGKETRINGLTLMERSPYFRQQLPKYKSDDAGNRVVKLKEIGVEALDVFLTFLQTATLPQDKWKQQGILEELTMAAHKCQVLDLLEFLEQALEIVCTPKNCADLIVLSKKLGLAKAERTLLSKYREEWREAGDLERMRELFERAAVAACPKEHVKVKDISKKKEKLKKISSLFF